MDVLEWSIELGRATLLGKASDFSEIKSITLEDEPVNQKMIAYGQLDPGWSDALCLLQGA